jgi:hypothetical protein
LKEQRDLAEKFAWDKNTSPDTTLNAMEAISEYEDFGKQISEMFESATSRALRILSRNENPPSEEFPPSASRTLLHSGRARTIEQVSACQQQRLAAGGRPLSLVGPAPAPHSLPEI